MSNQALSPLPFRVIDRIVTNLRARGEDALQDLVMLLPQDDQGDKVMLIYNRKEAPGLDFLGWQSVVLKDIEDAIILQHQKLIIAWSGLDAIFPSLIPYGPQFFHLRRIFTLLGRTSLGMETAWRLGQTLYKDFDEITRQRKAWAEARIIQLSLPYALRERPKAGLLGVIIPDLQGLFHKDTQAQPLQYFYLNELAQAQNDGGGDRPPPGSWVAALPELHEFGFLPRVHPTHRRFLHLRPILHAATWKRDVEDTVKQLARYAWEQWERTGDPAWRARAYRLAAEARFIQDDDPTAIVALRPANNFEAFLQTGQSIRYQRTPALYQGAEETPGETRHVLSLSEEGTRPRVLLGLPVLKRDAQVEDADWIDWRTVLLRAGRKHELARMLWLFSRELLPPLPSADWKALQAGSDVDKAMDQLFVAYYYYNLLDPWRWRQGRYPLFIRQLHQTMGEMLKNIANEEASRSNPTQHYTRGLAAWYGNSAIFAQDIPTRLSAMMDAFRHYLDALGLSPAGPLEERRRQIAQHFITVAQYLLEVSQRRLPDIEGMGVTSTPGLYRRLHMLLQEDPFFEHISPFFQRALQRYHHLRLRWLQYREATKEGSPPSADDLRRLVEQYNSLERTTFALRHECHILKWLLQRDRAHIQRLLDALAGGPILQFGLLNPWVIRGVPDILMLQITNVGQDTAFHFTLRQVSIQGARDPIVDIEIPLAGDLARHETRTWRWRVQAQEEALTLSLQYTYLDARGQKQEGEHTLNVPVRRRRIQLPLVIANPYRAGTPVYGPDLFRGREEILRNIFSRLLTGNTQPILLRGPRRIGKTSLLRQLHWMMNDWEALEALGLQRDQLPFLQRQLMVNTSLQDLDPSHPEHVRLFFQNILQDIHRQAQIREPLRPERTDLTNLPAVAFRKILSHWIDAFIHAPVIILLDEWDDIYRKEFQTLSRNLRSVIEARPLEHVNWIVSSTWVMVRETSQFGSPFYNQTYNLEVGPLTWDAARRLVIEPSERVGVDWMGEAVVAVLQATGRRPYLLQLACSKALDELARDPAGRQKALVSVDILHRALADILQDAQSSDQYFGFLWDVERKSTSGQNQVDSMGRLILWALTEAYPQSWTRIEIQEAILKAFQEHGFSPLPMDLFEEHLHEQLLLLHRIFDAVAEQHGRYTLSIPLIHAWLKERLARYGSREALIASLCQAARREMDISQP